MPTCDVPLEPCTWAVCNAIAKYAVLQADWKTRANPLAQLWFICEEHVRFVHDSKQVVAIRLDKDFSIIKAECELGTC